ncbi:MAG: methyltransferase domain-containing protein [Streptococcaceae bacterium]|nr:methyltransferase domain-containing protein [Streptococcaceae bacterium]
MNKDTNYEQGHELIGYLSDFFLRDSSVCYEIGCSTGRLIGQIAKRHFHKSNIQFIGIEPVKEMIDIAKKEQEVSQIKFLQSSIEAANLKPCDLVLSYYCLQFVSLSQRDEVCKKIYNALNTGGAFILFEKEIADDPKINKLITSSYIKFKVHNGFSSEEVLSKQLSLEGVMKTNTHSENKKMLIDAGFQHVSTIMKYGEFTGYVCIK